MNYSVKLKWIGLFILIPCIAFAGISAPKKKEDKKPEKKQTAYEKLFKDKRVETAKSSFITLHKMDSKIFVELPVKYFNKEMLLGTTISSVSDPTILNVGMKNSTPIHLRFERQDSSVVMKAINSSTFYDKADTNLDSAIRLNFRDPSVASFKIEAFSPDSSAVVFNMSTFMAEQNPLISIIPKSIGVFNIASTPKKELSFIKQIKAFENNASVRTELNYMLSTSIMNIVPVVTDAPVAIEVTHTLLLLPEEKMSPRISDSRVGIFSSAKSSFSSDKDKIEPIYFAHRWKLVPKDVEAYKNGKLSEPEKPIVFYLDNAFPESWKPSLRKGILRWNKAFEKIGFSNAVQVVDFPKNDPNFDPDNLSYSCIRYIPNTSENAMGPSWVDPSTGEIINASVLVYNNVEQLLYKWRFTQTANVDPSVRAKKLPKNILNESLDYVIAHEVGHTLGLMHNMAASSAYATDSLRSATFTKEHGTTPSIMDYARFNYVAQPQDKNVTLTPPELGVYDYYAIEWNYKYFPELNNNIKLEAKQLEAFVDEKAKNRFYRYVPEMYNPRFIDPSSVAEDLGDDPIKSSNYGIKNLKNISKNLPNWIKDDEDSSEKDKLDLAIAQQFHSYLRNVLNMVGGTYLNISKESSGIPRYTLVPKNKQREALLWSVKQIKDFQSFANREMEKNGFINVSYYDQLLEYIVGDLFKSRARVIVSSSIDSKTYSLQEFFDDLYAEIFKNVDSKSLSDSERFLQRYFVENAMSSIEGRNSAAGAPPTGISLTDAFFEITNRYGYLPQESKLALDAYKFGNPAKNLAPQVDISKLDNSNMYFYGALLKLQPLLKSRVATASSPELKAHYQFLLYKVEKTMNNKK